MYCRLLLKLILRDKAVWISTLVLAPLLTDLTALDLDTLDRTLEFLANNEAQIETQVLPGDDI